MSIGIFPVFIAVSIESGSSAIGETIALLASECIYQGRFPDLAFLW